MRVATKALSEISPRQIDLQIRLRLFIWLLGCVAGSLAVGYLIFWRPLLNRWIF